MSDTNNMAVILEFNKEKAMEKIRIKDNDMSAGSEILMQMKYHDLKFEDLSRMKKPQINADQLHYFTTKNAKPRCISLCI